MWRGTSRGHGTTVYASKQWAGKVREKQVRSGRRAPSVSCNIKLEQVIFFSATLPSILPCNDDDNQSQFGDCAFRTTGFAVMRCVYSRENVD